MVRDCQTCQCIDALSLSLSLSLSRSPSRSIPLFPALSLPLIIDPPLSLIYIYMYLSLPISIYLLSLSISLSLPSHTLSHPTTRTLPEVLGPQSSLWLRYSPAAHCARKAACFLRLSGFPIISYSAFIFAAFSVDCRNRARERSPLTRPALTAQLYTH